MFYKAAVQWRGLVREKAAFNSSRKQSIARKGVCVCVLKCVCVLLDGGGGQEAVFQGMEPHCKKFDIKNQWVCNHPRDDLIFDQSELEFFHVADIMTFSSYWRALISTGSYPALFFLCFYLLSLWDF